MMEKNPGNLLSRGNDGDFYGTTVVGGVNDDGTVFKTTSAGTFTSLHSFDGDDGYCPYSGLFLGADGSFYGSTTVGGANADGNLYKITSSGAITNICSFPDINSNQENADGFFPSGRLVQASNGMIYGTAAGGGADADGTVYRLTISVKPTITSFTRSSGPVGTQVKITGTGFTGATAVTFKSTAAATFQVTSATSITATVPAGAATGSIWVTTPGGTATSTTNYTVVPPPAITSFTPASGAVGVVVTITGTNLSGATAVTFNGVAAAKVDVVSSTSVRVLVSSGATTGKISVTTPEGKAASTGTFTVTISPTITSFTPASGMVGVAVTMTGTNLTGATAVKFNGVAAAKIDILSSTSVRVLVPTGATTGKISLTTPGGTATSSGSFTVN